MSLLICTLITILFHTLFVVWTSNNVTSIENKLSRFKFCALSLVIFIGINVCMRIGNRGPFMNLAMLVFILISIIIFFKDSILDAFIGFGLSYSLILILSDSLITFHHSVLTKLNLKIPSEFQIILFIYIPIWLVYLTIYKFKKYIFDVTISLKRFKSSVLLIIHVDYALILMDSLHIKWITENMGLPFKSILYFITFLIFAFTILYFAKISDTSKEVTKLNIALNSKITELKKIKHDYGSEISSLYGLYQLGKTDELGELLKGIVDRYQVFVSAVDVRIKASPITESVLNYAVNSGINVIAFDNCDYNQSLAISNNDLLRVLTNIVKNSIDALVNVPNPSIKFSSYNGYNGIIITIINNGPEILREIIDKIFESDFSTKENTDGDRGYGLSIVKDIVVKCGGTVSVQSNPHRTQFRVEIPYKTP